MSDRYIEKVFLYLLAVSAILHAAVFALFLVIPAEKRETKQEPYMVELRDLPVPKELPGKPREEVKRLDEQRRRVEKETAPRGERERERLASIPRQVPSPVPVRPQPPQPQQLPAPSRVPQQAPSPRDSRKMAPQQAERGGYPAKREPPRGEEGIEAPRPRREQVPDLAKLLPGAGKMAKLEESYRKKYGEEVEEGETKFLNTDDIQFGSFLRRFENAVYGVWRYPPDAVRMGIEGTTPVRITFNRNGEVVKAEILESSGSRILDEEVTRTLKAIGPVGSFPKGYQRETFKLIAFFQYGIISGGSRSLH
ncbi:energy transducer TonB [Geobacter sp. DSM 9736]|uniref:energy transducer TonB n=1 Tax=Geobacter sp. DSM 9736 TaxID=1277350 RepID=UPI000B50F899|nr:energy transducer TonB [Geobacter sp. DSM 9736]SNB45924.1 protein TonB [Geobacter sp. DSM 9736]